MGTAREASRGGQGFQQAAQRAERTRTAREDLLRTVQSWHGNYLTAAGDERGRFVICAGLAVLEYLRSQFPLAEHSFVTDKREIRTSGRFIQRILERFGIRATFASAGGRTTKGTLEVALDLAARINRIEGISDLDPGARNDVVTTAQGFLATRADMLMRSSKKPIALDASLASSAIIGSIFATAPDERSRRMMIRFLTEAMLESVVGGISVFNPGIPSAATDDEFSLLIGDACISIDSEADPRRVADLGIRYWDGYLVYYVVPGSEVSCARTLVEREAATEDVVCIAAEDLIGMHIDFAADFDHDQRIKGIRDLIDRYNRRVALLKETRHIALDVKIASPERRLVDPTA